MNNTVAGYSLTFIIVGRGVGASPGISRETRITVPFGFIAVNGAERIPREKPRRQISPEYDWDIGMRTVLFEFVGFPAAVKGTFFNGIEIKEHEITSLSGNPNCAVNG